MKSIARIYDAITDACFVGLAGAALIFTCVAVLFDVGLRAAGLQPPIWTSATTEYAMVFLTMAIAPYLVRHHGHVRVETFGQALPPRAQLRLHNAIGFLAFGLCSAITVVAVHMGMEAYLRGELDVRSIELPRWVLFAVIVVGFGFCAVEFLRQALARGSIVADDQATKGL